MHIKSCDFELEPYNELSFAQYFSRDDSQSKKEKLKEWIDSSEEESIISCIKFAGVLWLTCRYLTFYQTIFLDTSQDNILS